MEALAGQQVSAGQALERMLTNFYKDSRSRKTGRYYENRLKKLEAEWNEFGRRDTELQKFRATNMEHPYFKEAYFFQAQEVYEDLKGELRDGLNELEEAHSIGATVSDGTNQTKINEIAVGKRIIRQQSLIGSMRQAIENVNKLLMEQPDRSLAFCQQHLATLANYWTTISDAHHELVAETTGYNSASEVSSLEVAYQDLVVRLMETMAKFGNGSSETLQSHVKLPTVTIPTFAGDYLKWSSFAELFKQMIGGTALPKIQKMFYLKTNLAGEASRLIAHLPVSEENYQAAWDILCNRYNNQRLIVSAFLNSLLSIPSFTSESPSYLKRMHDTVRESLFGIKNLGVDTANWDPLIVHLLLRKIDKETHRLFEHSLKDPRQVPKLDTLLSFIESRFQLLEGFGEEKSKKHDRKHSTLLSTKEKLACACCKQQCGNLRQCSKFLQLSIKARYELTKKLHRCLNCLQEGHQSKNCSSRSCLKCNKRHHTLLHYDTAQEAQRSADGSSTFTLSTSGKETTHSALSCLKLGSYVFLGTAAVNVKARSGQYRLCRAVLDSGSQLNFISERFFHKLGHTGSEQPIDISGIGGSQLRCKGRVTISLQSRISNYTTMVEAIILPEITSDQPSREFDTARWPIPKNIQLADPEFNTPRRIDILLGADVYAELMIPGQIKLKPELPTLQNSVFGWVVLGRARCNHEAASFSCYVSTLDTQLQRFWELEEDLQDGTRPMTKEEKQCEDFVLNTMQRNSEGRFIVKLPFRESNCELGQSRCIAIQRFLNQERRLDRKPELRAQYVAFMDELLNLDHMEKIELQRIPENHYFLPHHYVLNPESTTTALRVVFDGSCKTSNQASLNDTLLVGPTIQEELFSILLRFRLHRYVFTADITKMYRQILVNEEDQWFQLIAWRRNPIDKLEYYKLKTVTYGTSCAPYLAIKVLQSLAQIHSTKYPLAAKITRRDFYVDDVITGANSLEEALKIRDELKCLLLEGGFPLRKWCANHPQLLSSIPREELQTRTTFEKDEESHIKCLGMKWYPKSDTYGFHVKLPEIGEVTKRSILRDIAHIYDPLGLINPVVTKGKIFLQQLWQSKADWDAVLENEIRDSWLKFRGELENLNAFVVPRYALSTPDAIELQLHAFSDASEKAYGTAIYIRCTTSKKATTRLLCARSRIAPLKQITLPRLELCGAHLMVKLMKKVQTSLCAPINKVVFWTDSTIALSWIKASSTSFKTFVANRVAYIQEQTEPAQWRYVPTKENPADIVSRGATPRELQKCHLWLQGPQFLEETESKWPNHPTECMTNADELRKPKTVLTTAISTSFLDSINHKNSFRYLQHIIAYIKRFGRNTHKNTTTERRHGIIHPSELQNALHVIIRLIQADAFAKEKIHLTKDQMLPPKHPLRKLKPFIDQEGLIRVGGRLEKADVEYDAKYQLLLPYSNNIVTLLITMIHEDHLHVGPQELLAIVRQRFWPLKGRKLTQTVVHRCLICIKAKPKLMEQLMGNLPKERIQPARPFTTVGVDFFGPVYIHYKIRGKAPTKAYVSVFICFCTKAVHLELVSNLTKEAFIGALKRFIARRGKPCRIYCDNATNFVGAKNELKELRTLFADNETQSDIAKNLAKENIEWSFIPPRTPHFGGLWEAGVKSAKYHLKRVTQSVSLTYEELHTIMVQIEAIHNSRPLTPLYDNPNDLQALTPGHFLIGAPLTSLPNPRGQDENFSALRRKELIEACQMEFWKRWSKEYLQHLQITTKWKTAMPTLSPGTLVLVKDENTIPQRWPLGRVLKEYKGTDGLTRVVDIKTAKGIVKRAVHNLCRLPLDDPTQGKRTILPKQNNLPQALLAANVCKPRKRSTKRKIQPINSNWIASAAIYKTYEEREKREPQSPSSPKKVKNSISCRGSTLSQLALMLLVLIVAPVTYAVDEPTIDHFIQVSPFEERTSVYFEEISSMSIITDQWTMLVFCNLEAYWENFKNIKAQLKQAHNICYSIQSENRKQCALLTSQLQAQVDIIQNNNDLLVAENHTRKRRSPLDIVGMISNKLFGILDQGYADKIADTINQIKGSENYMMSLVKNQTSLIDATTNLITHDREFMNNQLKTANHYLNEILHEFNATNKILSEHQFRQTFNTLSTHLTLVITAYQFTQTALINVITDGHNGRINPIILTPKQLWDEVRFIKEHLPAALTIPGQPNRKSLLQLYQLMTVQTRMTENLAIFKVNIPLLRRESLRLVKVIPVPFIIHGEGVRIKTNSKFLAVTLHRDFYYTMTENDIHRCLVGYNGHYTCYQQHAIYFKDNGPAQCELALLNQASILPNICNVEVDHQDGSWIQLHDPNSWIYVAPVAKPISIACGDHTFQHTLHGTGLLRFIADCSLKQDSIVIHSHHQHTNIINRAFMSKVFLNESTISNRLTHQLIPEFHHLALNNNTNDISQLKKTIQMMKEQEYLPKLTPTHTYYIAAGNVITIVLLLTVIAFYVKNKRASHSSSINPSATHIDFHLRPRRNTLS